jgi:hypothetical protein
MFAMCKDGLVNHKNARQRNNANVSTYRKVYLHQRSTQGLHEALRILRSRRQRETVVEVNCVSAACQVPCNSLKRCVSLVRGSEVVVPRVEGG